MAWTLLLGKSAWTIVLTGKERSARPLANRKSVQDKLSNKLRDNVETTMQSEIWKCRGGVQ